MPGGEDPVFFFLHSPEQILNVFRGLSVRRVVKKLKTNFNLSFPPESFRRKRTTNKQKCPSLPAAVTHLNFFLNTALTQILEVGRHLCFY